MSAKAVYVGWLNVQFAQRKPAEQLYTVYGKKYSSYTELLIGPEALMSYDWRRYCVVRIGPYSLNNLRLG